MSHFKIATWNVNSLRVRLEHVSTWLAAMQPDVLALQEIKLVDADFPLAAIQNMGYTAIYSGQKTYNGMALLVKTHNDQKKISSIVRDLPELSDPQRRVLGALIDDVYVLNLYVPNGDNITSEKYQYKLNWLTKLAAFLQNDLQHSRVIILGDFNIAPEEIDVHDPLSWEGKVLFSQPERQAFKDILQIGFVDCFRKMHPEEKAFSWWDYRLNAYQRNRGLRIDHVLASHAVMSACTKCYIDQTPRAWMRPSDHAPVIAEFNFNLY
ncbi:MAG: exodeoxyribonuclease III [Gammaproteobacteria bacterium]|nr:exodeoxyribonuclease III [Gammaproteobacteria bacterium]